MSLNLKIPEGAWVTLNAIDRKYVSRFEVAELLARGLSI